MPEALIGARIFTPDQELPRGGVLIEGGRIAAVGPEVRPPPGARVSELSGLTLIPGLIDIHVHGGGGFSLAGGDPDALRAYARWAVTRGVTAFLASICADGARQALPSLEAVAAAVGPVEGGAELLGAHLEGPFISSRRRGALPPRWPRKPSLRLLGELAAAARGHLRIITIAPELPGAGEVMAAAREMGAVVALGHTDAGYREAADAFGAGASHLTHAFNALRPFHHREPGPVLAAAEAGATAEIIADGVHVHPAAVRLLARLMGPERLVLVSDGAPPAGLSAGSFRLGEAEARLEGERVVLPGGTLAGSAATLDRCLANVVRWGAATLADAARMASTVPARLLGLEGRKGRIAPGYDADLVALDEELAVVMTWARGQLLHFWPKGWQG